MTDDQNRIILTGIKPTGTPHIGNYFGAIEPAIRRANEYSDAFFFIADYHALNSVQDGETMRELTHTVTATWLAAGLDPSKIHFYRQSDIIEEFEIVTILNNFIPKGWMNKMHAYKASVDKNKETNKPDDNDINMGLYVYPILMACDILQFNATHVPVGRDQIQHIEIARDIALRFNNQFKENVFVLPEHVVEEGVQEVPGLDGRKMSKSYGNTIPLYAGREGWEKAVRKIVTDSIDHTQESIRETVFYKMYAIVANAEQSENIATKLVEKTIGWKEAKDLLLEALEARFSKQAEHYNELIQNPAYLDAVLAEGATTIRPIARATLDRVKKTLGI